MFYYWLRRLDVFSCAVCFVAMALNSTPIGATEKATNGERLGTLHLLEAQNRANQERLTDFSGTYELTDGARRASVQVVTESPDGTFQLQELRGDFWVERKVMVNIALDALENKLFTTYESYGKAKLTNLETGEVEEVDEVPLRERHVITGEHWIKSTPAPANDEVDMLIPIISRGKGVNSAIRVISEESNPFKTFSTVIDPRRFLTFSGDMTFADHLQSSADWLSSGKDLPAILEEIPDPGHGYIVRQEFRLGGAESKESPTVVETTYQEKSGYLPVHFLETNPSGNKVLERSWKYEEVSGVYIPAHYLLVKHSGEGTDAKVISREFRIVDVHVNEGIPDETFGWAKLGLVECDQVQDRIAGTTFRFSQQNGLVPAETYVEPEPVSVANPQRLLADDSSRSTLVYVIAFNSMIGIVVCVLYFIKKRAQRRKRSRGSFKTI